MEKPTPEQIRRHLTVYLGVFGALALLTLVTVGVSYLGFAAVAAVVIAMVIASIKGGLVAAFFMHLVGEKPIVLVLLLFTFFFFLVLLIIPVLS